jgi:hypothetical protein
MSFFEKSSGGELPPPGTYYAVLSALEVKLQDDYNDPTQKVQRVQWTWTTTSFRKTDSKPVLIFEWTGPRYGNPKANLTKRLDALYPKLTTEQRAELEPAQMVNITMAQIELVRERNDKGEPKNVIALMKPIRSLPESSWLPDEDEEDFEDSATVRAAGAPVTPAAPGTAAAPSAAPAQTPNAAPSMVSAPAPMGIEEGDPFAEDPATSDQLAEIQELCDRLSMNAVNTSQNQYNLNPDKLNMSQATDFLVKLKKKASQTAAAIAR